MQGFLALGLVVGITGLGVVMVRAVRERRRTIGVLRALGVPRQDGPEGVPRRVDARSIDSGFPIAGGGSSGSSWA